MILEVFGQAGAPQTMSTSTLFDRVSKAAGGKIPEYSVRSALRTLVRRKVLKPRREGREKSYTFLGGSAPIASAPKSARVPRKSSAPLPGPGVPNPPFPMPTPAESVVTASPHKLAVGEALVLHVGEKHIETVTNVHGKLVVERHPRSRAAPV